MKIAWLGIVLLVTAGCQGVTSEKPADTTKIYAELEGAYHELGVARTDAAADAALEKWNAVMAQAKAELDPKQLGSMLKKFAKEHPEGARTQGVRTKMTGGVTGRKANAADGGECYGEFVPSDQVPLVRVRCCMDHRMMGVVMGTPWQCGAGVRCPGCPSPDGGE